MFTLLYLKRITNRDLLCSTWNSAQCYVAVWMGGESGGEWIHVYTCGWGFPGGSDGKASACNAGDPGSIPGLGRNPGEGKSCPPQYCGLENSMDKGAWMAAVHRLSELDMVKVTQHTGMHPGRQAQGHDGTWTRMHAEALSEKAKSPPPQVQTKVYQ